MRIELQHETQADMLYMFMVRTQNIYLFGYTLYPERECFVNLMNDDELEFSLNFINKDIFEKALRKNIDEYNKHEDEDDFDCRIIENNIFKLLIDDKKLFYYIIQNEEIQQSLIKGIWVAEAKNLKQFDTSDPSISIIEI